MIFKKEKYGGVMNKNLMAFSIIFLGLCIVLGSWFISQSLRFKKDDVVKIQQEQNRYEYIKTSDDYDMIFDKQTGDYWGNLQGEWEKHTPLISNHSN